MPNIDYNIRTTTSPLCPTATLSRAVLPLDEVFLISVVSSPSGAPVRIGSAALIDDEIVAVTAISGSTYTMARGCCDTVPAPHAVGATIWFFDDAIASDGVEYGSTETISVKPLPKTATNLRVPIEQSPPATITFASRFARPYPPGNVQVQSQPWFVGATLSNLQTSITLSWNHRDRVTQQDLLVPHQASDIGPEPGTTYEVSIHLDNGTQVAEFVGITGKTFSYTHTAAITDFNAATQPRTGTMRLRSRRGGFASWQQYVVPLTIRAGNETLAGSVVSDLALSYTVDPQPPTPVTRDLPISWIVFNTTPPAPVLTAETGNFIADQNGNYTYTLRASGQVTRLTEVAFLIADQEGVTTVLLTEGIHISRAGNTVTLLPAGLAVAGSGFGTVVTVPARFEYFFIPT
jgi:hypothetical protein